MTHSASLTIFVLLTLTASRILAQNLTGFIDEVLTTPCPKAISDFTAVVNASTGKVYLAGGCDSTNGNQYNTVYGKFVCGSISNKSYIFDLNALAFTTTADMPVARYRHAAVLVNNQVWLVGGRDINDNVIATVDVYDVEGDKWTTYKDLDAKYQVSDSAGFAGPDNLAYFAGGYNLTYGAFPTLFTIDPVATKKANATLVVKERAPMPTARGDLAAVTATYNIAHYALVAGGFTDENLFCAPLAVTERYNFADDTWSASKDLVLARADMAMVTLSNRIFAIAGERQITNICNISKDNLPDPGDQTVPIDDVEWFNETTDEWSVIMDLPQHRFRFAAIGYQDAIYSFGGQLAFDKSCQCFKTTDEVVVYTQSFVNSTSDAGTTMKSTADAATSTKWGALLLASGIALWVY